jgi:pimeloyl-ACP methyl ester carboxylesterase
MTAMEQPRTSPSPEAVRGYRPIEELIPPHWSEGDVTANGIRHHYYRTGSGGGAKPPLVLLHGFQESGLSWLRAARALERNYDAIMLDARGHGRSDGVATGYSPELLAEDAAGAIRALSLDRPILLGHSMGATTAALVATSPDLVRAVILEDPAWEEAPRAEIAASEGYRAWLASWIGWLEGLRAQSHEERLVSALSQLPPGAPVGPEEDYVPWVDACAHVDLDLIRRGVELWSIPMTPVRELMPRIACPALVMRASSPFPVPRAPRDVREEDSPWSHVRIVRFENTGHLIRREEFDRYIETVRAFLHEQ